MLTRLFALALSGVLFTVASGVRADGLVEGRDYSVIQPAQPTASGDRIEVLEVFGYWCIHCAHLDPSLEAWKKKLPEDVAFSYVPAIFSGGVDEYFARAFYTAETMGVLDKTHSAMFNAAAVERSLTTPDSILDFYEKHGVSRTDFEATMNSFTVNAKVARVKQTLPRYAIDGTPAIIVNGKYRVMSPRDGGFPRMLQVTDLLIQRERVAKGG